MQSIHIELCYKIMNAIDDPFLREVFKHTVAGMSVLDVGAGALTSARAFQKAGYVVTAIDIRKPLNIPGTIRFLEKDFIKWDSDQKYDVVFMRNSAQFMSKEKLFEKILMMEPKVVVIKTFYGPPIPDFEGKSSMTYYDIEDFSLPGYTTKLLTKGEYDGTDMKGTPRRFRVIEYIGVKQ